MITVEELIVQSLYHRLVLIRVRRTQEVPANPDDGDGDNANASALQAVGSESSEAAASSEGLGKYTDHS